MSGKTSRWSMNTSPAEGANRPRWLSLGWRATDAGDRPRADGPAQADPDGRAVHGPVALAGEGSLRDHPPDQPRSWRHDPAGRTERPHGSPRCQLRLYHGVRQGRARRYRGGIGQQRGREGILPWRWRRGAAQLQEPEELQAP